MAPSKAARDDDREPDQPHGHLGWGWLGGSLADLNYGRLRGLVEHVGELLGRQRYINVSCSHQLQFLGKQAWPHNAVEVRDDVVGYRTRVTSVAIVGLFLLASEAAPQPPTIREPPLVIEGRVLWIDFGSQAMALAPSNNTPAVTIDLRRIPQSDYHGFRGSEYVRVVGFILRPSRRIQAFEIYLMTPWFPTEPP